VLFLLAIPLLGAPPLVLFGVAAATIAFGPVLLVATADAGLPYAGSGAEPTFSTLFQDPAGLLAQLFLTGEFPVVVYLAYLCVGLAIGRLDLRSPRLAWLLLGAGAAVALASRIVSAAAHPDQPGVIVEKAASLLTEMPQAAPAQIREAVTVVVDDLRAEAGVPGVAAPDEATLAQAEASVDVFEEQSC
jgi:hypothetical protein